MNDRVSTYPGRVRMTPVSGQTNVYDLERADQPTEEGTPLNKANLLTDAVAEFLGLSNTATPNDAFDVLGKRQKALLKYTDINESGTWTVPSNLLFGKIFVMAVGGGGGGGTGTSSYTGAGGGSGHIAYGTLNVTPNQSITAIIGAGGAQITSTYNRKGNNGGTTTFGSLSAAGGTGGDTYSSSGYYGGYGGAGGGGGLTGLGGNGSFGGGGGSVKGKGGNGGPFGGGGYSYGSTIATGGTYGGNGGNGSTPSSVGAIYEGSFEMWDLAADYYGVEKVPRIPPRTNSALKVGGGGLGFSLNATFGAAGYHETGGCGMFAYPGVSSNSSHGAGGGLFYSPKVNATGRFYWGGAGFYSASNSQLRGAGGAPTGKDTGLAGGNGVIGIWYYTNPTDYLNADI